MNEFPIKLDAKLKVECKDAERAFTKLLNAIKAPFSWWAKYKRPVHEATAEVQALEIRVNAIERVAEALGIPRDQVAGVLLRAEHRELLEGIRQQQNIEAIVEGAARMLPSSVNDVPVDPDWIADFFEQCKNVGNEQMQALWSKILAGEVAEPGTFSRRTLAIVKTLSKREADLFTKLCSFVWQDLHTSEMYIVLDDVNMLNEYGLDYANLTELLSTELECVGVILVRGGLLVHLYSNEHWGYFDDKYSINPAEGQSPEVRRSTIVLTNSGRSLVPISGAEKNDHYKLRTIRSLEQSGRIVKLLKCNS